MSATIHASSAQPALPGIRLAWPGVSGTINSPAPVVEGEPTVRRWRLMESETHAYPLGGREGMRCNETFAGPGLRLTRSVWRSADGASIAVRLTLRNTGRKTRRLERLVPVEFTNPGRLRLGGVPAGKGLVLLQKREKNDVPGVYPLGQFSFRQGVDEIGEVFREQEKGALRLEGDPFALLKPPGEDAGPCLLAGFLSQVDALGTVRIETDEHRRRIDGFRLECAMDGVALPPGGSRSSEWAIVMSGMEAWDLVDDFAARSAAHHHVAPPARQPPSVWCSWYTHGDEFNEAAFRTELEAMSARRVPFDVFLIDDFRPRAWGDWMDCPTWPAGIRDAADRIRAAGYRPGFWTCPFVVEPNSKFAREHPAWMLRRRNGEPVLFRGRRRIPAPRTDPADPEGEPLFTVIQDDFFVLDPTFPGAEDFLEDLYRRLTFEYGFTYHKFDFMRAVFQEPDAAFYDRSATRLQAYRRGLAAIRRGAGPGAYLAVCGGHFGGSMGLADSQRSGSDVRSRWDRPPVGPKIQQNLLRVWMNAFWHTDADALMVRWQPRPLKRTFGGRHTVGLFTPDEARTMAANQYVGGGLLCGSEPMAVIDDDRLALYRHVVPALRAPAVPMDAFRDGPPTRMLNRIEPRCPDLPPWLTLTVFNWGELPVEETIVLDDRIRACLSADRYLVTEFFTRAFTGLVDAGGRFGTGIIPPHGCRLWRLAPWDGRRPVLAGTDRHFSGGGVEMVEWQVRKGSARWRLESPWPGPVRVVVAFPGGRSPRLVETRCRSGVEYGCEP